MRMRHRYSLLRVGLTALALASFALTGCQNGTVVTPSEQEKFEHPPKDAAKQMQEFMAKHGQGGPPPATKK